MSSAPWLLSVGDDTLKLWDHRALTTASIQKPIAPIISIHGASWSSKADCLAVTAAFRDKHSSVFLLDVGKKGFTSPHFVDIFSEAPKSSKSTSSGQSSHVNHSVNQPNQSTGTKISRILAVFSNAGSTLACARSDGQVDIYSRKSSSVLKTLPSTASRQITALSFCLDDTTLLSGDDQGRVETWVWAAPENFHRDSPRFTIETKQKGVTRLYPVPFNPSLVISTHSSGSVVLLDIQNGELVQTFELAHLDSCRDFAFSPVNPFTAASVGRDNRLVIYDMKDRKKLNEIVADNSLTAVAFLPNGREVACGTSTGKILVFDLSKGATVQRSITAHTSAILDLAFPPENIRRQERTSVPSTPQSNVSSEASHHKNLSLNVEGRGISNGSSSEPPSAAEASSGNTALLEPKSRVARTVSLPKSKDTFKVPHSQSSIKPVHPTALSTATTVKSRRGANTETGQGDASAKMPPPNLVPTLQLNGSSDGVSLESSVEVEKTQKSKSPIGQPEEAFWTEERLKALRDDIVMESQIACLDVHDVIHNYCSATSDLVLNVEDKVDLLRNEVRENRQILQLILQRLTALERNVLY